MFSLSNLNFEGLRFRKNGSGGSKFVARDDLDVKHKRGVVKEVAEPLYLDTKHVELCDNKNEGVTRVKVLMTREEATRLLSKRNGKGVLNFKDVATELEQIPAARVSFIYPNINRKATLDTVPEEF